MSVTRRMYELAVKGRVPLKVGIELLAPCNLRCPHCYVTHNKRNKLDLATLERLFDDLAAMGTLYLTLTGGEIGLRKDLFQVIEAARRRHFSLTLLSTGTLWGEAEWDRIAALGVDQVRLSVYGKEACTHEAVTLVPGSFEKTLASARGLVERGIQVSLSCPIMQVNAHEVGDVVDLGRSIGAGVAIDAHITWTDRSDQKSALTRAQLEQLVGVFKDPRILTQSVPADDGCDTHGEDERPCLVGEMSCFIQCTGEVLPCVNWPEAAGNVMTQPIRDIWHTSPVFGVARGVTYKTLTGCGGCGDKGSCHPCAGMNLRERGSIGVPSDTVCQTAAARSLATRGVTRQERYQKLLPIVG